MNKGKIFRIIRGNGLKPENFDTMDENGIIYVIEDGIKYKLDGFNKSIVEDNKDEDTKETLIDLMKSYKDEIVFDDYTISDLDIRDGIVFIDDKSTGLTTEEYSKQFEKWDTDTDVNKEKNISDEELEEIKAIKKPRGWHFKEEFEDSEGNIYHKGVLVYIKKYDLKM